MKKSLIALAALAATGAFAQSSVTIDGVLDAGYQMIDYKGANVNAIGQNGSSTSGLNFRGSEDLGKGLRANFRFETNWNTVSNQANTGSTAPTAGTFGNGEIRLGLASNTLGAVDLGVVNYNSLTSFTTGQPFGTAIGSGFRAVAINDAQSTSAVRADNAIRYTSPAFSGFRATLYRSQKQTVATGTTFSSTLGAYDQVGTGEVGVNYNKGPINASFSQLKQNSLGVTNANGERTINTLGANYTMGAVTLFGLYQTNKSSNATTPIDNKYYAVSARYITGPITVLGSFGELENRAGQKSKLWALGADYGLSKRTALYARHESIDDKAGVVPNPTTIAAIGSETTRTRTAIGVRHTF